MDLITLLQSARLTAEVLRKWSRGDEVGNLFDALDREFGDTPGLSAAGLAPLRDNEQFLRALYLFWHTRQFDREALVAALESSVGRTAELTERQLAEKLADAINLLSPRAQATGQDLFGIELVRQELADLAEDVRSRDLRGEIAPQMSPLPATGWASALARDRLHRLIAEEPDLVAPLVQALAGLDDPRTTIVGLIADPPQWLADGHHRTWSAVGETADAYGLFEEASDAFMAASDRPTAAAERPKLMARAAVCSSLAGDASRYEELLDRARALSPHNIQVVLAELKAIEEPEVRLARLDEVPPADDLRDQAALAIAHAVSSLQLGDWPGVDADLALVERLDPSNVALRQVRPLAVIEKSRQLVAVGESVDVAELRRAASDLMELRQDFLESFRFTEAGHALTQAVEARAFADDREEAAALLDQVTGEERSAVAAELVAAAVLAHDDRAEDFLPDQLQQEADQLLAAEAAVFSSDLEKMTVVIETLDRLLNSDDTQVRDKAAYIRQVAAMNPEITSNEEAQRLLDHAEPELGALVAAERLHAQGSLQEAERRLAPFHHDVRVLRTLMRSAARQSDWGQVLDLSAAVIAKASSPIDRLIHADALKQTERPREALSELRELGQDGDVPRSLRSDAYAHSAETLIEIHDYDGLARISAEWLELDASPAAPWARLLALHRLARPTEALALARDRSLEPRDVPDAELLAAVLGQGEDPAVAVHELAELSDRFGRPERLEGYFLLVWLRVPHDRAGPLVEEANKRLGEFTERYPDSELIRAVTVDTTPEGVTKFFREHLAPRATAAQEIAGQVARGEAALVVLAASLGKSLALLRVEGRGVLLSFGDPELASLERETARASIGRSTVWDPTAIAGVALLPVVIGERVRSAYPGSVIAQATLDDVVLSSSADPESQRQAVMSYDVAADRPLLIELSEETVALEQQRLDRALSIAQSLVVRPDVDPGEPTELDQLLSDAEKTSSFLTWPASLAIATREKRPLFSDDPWVRLHARRAGIESFGTIAAIDALLERGSISEPERVEARRALRELGGYGLQPSIEELVDEARSTGWVLTEGLRWALLDSTQWRHHAPPDSFRLWGSFLEVAFNDTPASFEAWVQRFMDATKAALPHRSYGSIAELLLLITWQPFRPDRRPFIQALIRELRRARYVFGWYRDPVMAVATTLQELGGGPAAPEIQQLVARLFFQDVEFSDQLRLAGIRP